MARTAWGETVYSTVASEAGLLRLITQPDTAARPITSIVEAATPLADMEQAMAGLNRALFALLPLGLLGAALGGVLLAERVLSQVRQIAQAAERVGRQNLTARLPSAGGDEFAARAASFNAVLDRLEQAFYKQVHVQVRRRKSSSARRRKKAC